MSCSVAVTSAVSVPQWVGITTRRLVGADRMSYDGGRIIRCLRSFRVKGPWEMLEYA
jgi:hypothetical protein